MPAPSLNLSEAEHLLSLGFLVSTVEEPPGMEVTYGMFKGRQRCDMMYFERPLLKGLKAKILLRGFLSRRPEIVVNKAYVFWTGLRYSKLIHGGKYLTSIAVGKLLEEGYLPLHAAAVERNNRAVLLVAPSNTGKTQTVIRLMQQEGFGFLGEDIVLTDGKWIYACPYTQTLEIRGSKGRNTVREHLTSKLFAPLPKVGMVASLLRPGQIVERAPIKCLLFLERGPIRVERITSDTAFSLLYNHNSLEFGRHWSNQILITSWLLTKWPDFHSLRLKEFAMISKVVKQSEVIFRISAPNSSHYPELVANILQEK